MVKLKQLCTLTLIKSKPTLSDDPSVSIKYGLFIKVVVESHRLSILVFAAQQSGIELNFQIYRYIDRFTACLLNTVSHVT